MYFANPYAFWGLLAIAIPILIHLFNFRRYQTIFFSNVKFLQDVYNETKQQSKLKHLIILSLRIITIVALVFAFAQPYIPNNSDNTAQTSPIIGIYIDNSFSTEALTQKTSVLEDEKNKVLEIVKNYPLSTRYFLLTNDINPKHSRLLSSNEIINEMEDIKTSTSSILMSDIYKILNERLSSVASSQKFIFLCSDFQKSTANLTTLSDTQNAIQTYLLPSYGKNTANLYIDSCWMESPVFRQNQAMKLALKISTSNTDIPVHIPVQLYINNEMITVNEADIEPHSSQTVFLNYTLKDTGWQKAEIRIDDTPITFDNQYYLTYEVKPYTNICLIYDQKPNNFAQSLWTKDSTFNTIEMNIKSIDYQALKQAELVILSDIENLTNGLILELKNYLENGGNLLILPAYSINTTSYQQFFKAIQSSYYDDADSNAVKVKSYNTESPFFKKVFDHSEEELNYPLIKKHYPIKNSAYSNIEPLLKLQNGNILLMSQKLKQGNLYLSAVGLDDRFGEAHRNALFIVALYNISILSSIENDLAMTIGSPQAYIFNRNSSHNTSVLKIKNMTSNYEFIPEQRSIGRETHLLFHDQIKESGFYNIYADNRMMMPIAFNYNRQESDLTYLSLEDLSQTVNNKSFLHLLEGKKESLKQELNEQLNGISLWRYAIILALITILIEIILLRFWKKV